MSAHLTPEDDALIDRMRNDLIAALGDKFDWTIGCIASAAFVASLLTFGVIERQQGDIATLRKTWIDMLDKLIAQRMAERRH